MVVSVVTTRSLRWPGITISMPAGEESLNNTRLFFMLLVYNCVCVC